MSLSILNYGLEVWSLNESTKLEGIHIHFCKHILRVRGQTQNNFVYGELGRTSLKSRKVVNVIRYQKHKTNTRRTIIRRKIQKTLQNNIIIK